MATSRRARLRRRARETALQLIYILSMRPEASADDVLELFPFDEAINLFCAELKEEGSDLPDKEKFPFITEFDLKLSDAERDEIISYASKLFLGVHAKGMQIEDIIRVNMESKWRPERLVAIDRAIIELALYEGIIARIVPVSVAISEAVEIAKTFGTEDSGRFVNGVLGRIARTENENE